MPLLERTGRRRHPHPGRHRAGPARRDRARRAGGGGRRRWPPPAPSCRGRCASARSRPRSAPLLPAALVALGRDHPALELMVTELDPVGVRRRAARTAARRGAGARLRHRAGRARPDRGLAAAARRDGVPGGAAGHRPARRRPDRGDPVGGTRDAAVDRRQRRARLPHRGAAGLPAAGFTPRVRHHADDFTAVLALVAAGQGVALVPQLAAGRPPAAYGWSRWPPGGAPASPTGAGRPPIRPWPRASPPSGRRRAPISTAECHGYGPACRTIPPCGYRDRRLSWGPC